MFFICLAMAKGGYEAVLAICLGSFTHCSYKSIINIYNFIHSSIKEKENNILTDLLYINNDIEENMKDVINNMDHNNFIILNKVDLDKLFDTIKATPHGEMVIMPK